MNKAGSADILRGWLAELEAAGKARGTIAVRRSYVSRCLEAIDRPIDEITRADLVVWLAAGDWGASARRNARSSVIMFFAWAERVGIIQASPAVDLPSVRQPRAVPRPCPDSHVLAALGAADPEIALAIEIMALCGLRRGEVCRIRSTDVSPVGKTWVLRVQGKGGHERVIPIPAWIAAAIKDRPGWLFPGGVDGHISAGWLGKRISKTLPRGFTPHTLRHRFGTTAYSTKRDIFAVQRLLGHASVATTQTYVAAAADSLAESAAGAWRLTA